MRSSQPCKYSIYSVRYVSSYEGGSRGVGRQRGWKRYDRSSAGGGEASLTSAVLSKDQQGADGCTPAKTSRWLSLADLDTQDRRGTLPCLSARQLLDAQVRHPLQLPKSRCIDGHPSWVGSQWKESREMNQPPSIFFQKLATIAPGHTYLVRVAP